VTDIILTLSLELFPYFHHRQIWRGNVVSCMRLCAYLSVMI